MLTEKNLHNYQRKGVKWVIENKHSALFKEMGLGKTVTTLTAIKKLIYEDLEIDTVLVIGPKRVIESTWDTELEKWGHLRGLKFSKVIGNERQRKEALRQKADVYLISRDNVAWLCGLYGGVSLPFDMLVIDELSSFKNPNSQRFKALKKIHFKRVVGLTGTPAPNGLIDLWAQMYLIDKGQRLGKFVTGYRQEYFKPGASNGHIVFKYVPKKGAEELIHAKIKDICLSMKSEDFLELPPKIINPVIVKLPPDVLKKYQEFEKDLVLDLVGKEITAINAAGLSNKLLQFANGAVYDDEKNYAVVHDLKIEAVKEIIEENNGKPVLIAYNYKSDLERLLIALKAYRPVKLETGKDIDDWNQGKIQVLLMHPASGGHGLNLQKGGDTIVWFGNTWSLELEQQLNARLHRQGTNASRVIIHKLVTEGTIDERILATVDVKAKGQERLMQAVRYLVEKYTKQFKT